MLDTLSSYITSYFNDPRLAAEFFGNSIAEYFAALVVFVAASLVFGLIQKIILVRLRYLAGQTGNDIDDTLIAIVGSVQPAFYFFVSIYLALRLLVLPPLFLQVITGVLLVWVAVQVVFALQALVDYVLKRRARSEQDDDAAAAYEYLGTIAKWLLWVLAILMILANFGINITSLIAGLGIAGIAVGFALQSILADLFSSFAIYFDKPFEAGDFIVLGDLSGVVEKIGIKTTRIRALQGEEVVVSNQELTSSRIQNFRKLHERRIASTISIPYDTEKEKVAAVPGMIKDAIEQAPNTRFDRAHLASFDNSALQFEFVYYVLSAEYGEYMDVQQNIHMALLEQFAALGIEFAHPTRTLYVTKT